MRRDQQFNPKTSCIQAYRVKWSRTRCNIFSILLLLFFYFVCWCCSHSAFLCSVVRLRSTFPSPIHLFSMDENRLQKLLLFLAAPRARVTIRCWGVHLQSLCDMSKKRKIHRYKLSSQWHTCMHTIGVACVCVCVCSSTNNKEPATRRATHHHTNDTDAKRGSECGMNRRCRSSWFYVAVAWYVGVQSLSLPLFVIFFGFFIFCKC